MGIRTGAQVLDGLRDGRQLYMDGALVKDVTKDPRLSGGARTMAQLYDMQNQPELRDEMTYESPKTGERVGMSFLQARTREDFVAAAAFLRKRPECSGKIGAVGFCWGGGMVNTLAARLPELAAAVPFYGSPPAAAEIAQVKAPLLLHFAGIDERINAAWPAYEAGLKAAGARYTAHQYAGTQHGFNNDTTPRFDAAAAKLAWDRTLAFLNQHLRS